jgi:hypothetical protein
MILHLDDVAMPPDCGGACRRSARFVLRAPEVQCVAPAGGNDCLQLLLVDTTFRLVRHGNEGPLLFKPRLDVIPSCARTTCTSSERLCAPTHMCWTDVAYDPSQPLLPARDHCQYCLGLAYQRCACWDGERALPDGTSCPLWLSLDYGVTGRCVGGVCVQ